MVTVFSPVGLNEDVVDLFEVHDAGLVADGFDERAQTQVAGAAQQAFAGTDDERQCFGREGVVTETGAIQLLNPAALLGDLPGQFAVVGIEPAVVRTGIGLSEVVCTALPLAIERAKSILDEFLLCV